MPPRKKITATDVSTALPLSEPKKTVKETSQISTLEQLKSEVGQQINALFDLLIKEINIVEVTTPYAKKPELNVPAFIIFPIT